MPELRIFTPLMLNYLLFAISYAFICVIQPGPFQAFLLYQSLSNGWRRTFPLVFVPLVSDIPVIVLVLFILERLPHGLLMILQCGGGVFLLYLAVKAFKSWRGIDAAKGQEDSADYGFIKAVTMNLLNPNPYLGWSLVLGPVLIKSWNEAPQNGIVLLAGFYGTMIILTTGMIMLFASARNLGKGGSRAAMIISVTGLAVFGVYQLWSGISGF
jgi:threonine/homoserine/homoserine lactone efflux protein